MGWTSGGVVARDFVNEGPSSAGRDSAIGAFRPEVHPYRTQYITYLEKISRRQIAIAAVCSLEICYIILNTSVKDRKVIYKSYNQNDNLLFPHCIGDFIPENDPVRVLDAIVEHLGSLTLS